MNKLITLLLCGFTLASCTHQLTKEEIKTQEKKAAKLQTVKGFDDKKCPTVAEFRKYIIEDNDLTPRATINGIIWNVDRSQELNATTGSVVTDVGDVSEGKELKCGYIVGSGPIFLTPA